MAILELENLYEYFCEIEAIFFNMSISRPDRLVSNNIGDYKFVLSDWISFAIIKLDYESLILLPLTPPSSGYQGSETQADHWIERGCRHPSHCRSDQILSGILHLYQHRWEQGISWMDAGSERVVWPGISGTKNPGRDRYPPPGDHGSCRKKQRRDGRSG